MLQALEPKIHRTATPTPAPPATSPSNPPPPTAAPTDAEWRSRSNTTHILWVVGLVGAVLSPGINPLGGLHRWYNGQIWVGVLWMFPVVGELGALIDGFFVSRIVDEYYQKVRGQLGVSATGVPLPPTHAETQVLPKPDLDRQRLKLLKSARARGGKLSVTQAVMDTSMSFSEVEAILDEMVRLGYISLENHPRTGVAVYHFPDL